MVALRVAFYNPGAWHDLWPHTQAQVGPLMKPGPVQPTPYRGQYSGRLVGVLVKSAAVFRLRSPGGTVQEKSTDVKVPPGRLQGGRVPILASRAMR